MVEKIVYIDVVNISLNVLQVNIWLFVTLFTPGYSTVISIFVLLFLIILIFLLIWFVLVGLLEPGMGENLWDS